METVNAEMSRKVVFVSEDDDLSRAYDSMRALEIQHVPVVRDEKVVGILSDRDVLRHAHQTRGKVDFQHIKVRDAMTTNVAVCAPSTSIGSAVDLMLERQIHCLPVIGSDQKLVGIITSSDLLRLLRDRQWRLELPLPFKFEMPFSLMPANLGFGSGTL